jgi:hypothetical protein
MPSILGRIVETPSGVYRAPMHRLALPLLLALLVLVVSTAAVLGRLSLVSTCIYAALAGAALVFELRRKRKFGPLGEPIVAVEGSTLTFARPWDSRGPLSISLENLKELIVYGRSSRRRYRFVNHSGTFEEAASMWTRRVEESSLRFLQSALPERLTIAEPQTVLAFLRDNGP